MSIFVRRGFSRVLAPRKHATAHEGARHTRVTPLDTVTTCWANPRIACFLGKQPDKWLDRPPGHGARWVRAVYVPALSTAKP